MKNAAREAVLVYGKPREAPTKVSCEAGSFYSNLGIILTKEDAASAMIKLAVDIPVSWVRKDPWTLINSLDSRSLKTAGTRRAEDLGLVSEEKPLWMT